MNSCFILFQTNTIESASAIASRIVPKMSPSVPTSELNVLFVLYRIWFNWMQLGGNHGDIFKQVTMLHLTTQHQYLWPDLYEDILCQKCHGPLGCTGLYTQELGEDDNSCTCHFACICRWSWKGEQRYSFLLLSTKSIGSNTRVT